MWLDTLVPGTASGVTKPQPFRRLLVAQDTGGAIKGAVRGDVFFGYGPKAEHSAGVMKEIGGYYIMLPKSLHK